MDSQIVDLHIHSHFSYDSLMSPERILQRAKKIGYTCLAITDHGTIRGAIEAKKLARQYQIDVIIGTEIKTDRGDIIGLNLQDEIASRKWQEVIEEIRVQGGISVLPHPFRDHMHETELGRSVDYIEIWNSRCSLEENNKSIQLAEDLNKPGTFGSDAHCLFELGLVKTRVQWCPYKIQNVICAEKSNILFIKASRITSILKKWMNMHS